MVFARPKKGLGCMKEEVNILYEKHHVTWLKEPVIIQESRHKKN